MTSSSYERQSGSLFETPDYGEAAKNAANSAMYDMYWLWDDDDPHPGLEMLKKANTLTWPADVYGKQERTLIPNTAGLQGNNPFKGSDTFEARFGDFSGPSFKANDGGLMSNFSTGNKDGLAGQVGASIYTGKNADGQRLTEEYGRLNPYRDQRQTRANETLWNARKQMESVVSPKMGSSPVGQSFGSMASNRHNQGVEYLPAMQGYFQNGYTKGFLDSNETEAGFSSQIVSRVIDMTKDAYSRHYELAIQSIDGAGTSYSKRYPENPRYYETLPQRLAEPGAEAITERKSLLEVNDDKRKLFSQWQNGAEVSRLKYAGITSGALSLMSNALPQKEGIVNDQRAFERHINENNRKREVREKRANMISATQLKGKDAAETLINLKRWCSETLFGEYAIDLGLIAGTGGKAAAPMRIIKVMAAISNFSDRNQNDQDAIENVRINRQFRFGEDESEAHTRLNEMADRLDQNSSTAVKFLIKVIPDQMRQDFIETYDGVRKDW